MDNNVKSATTAGVLGIFLGAVGAHDWYLGRKTQGIIHVALFAGGIVLFIVALVLTATLSFHFIHSMGWLLVLMDIFSWIVLVGNAIWGLVEAIIILSQGDAGLAQKGYAVAMPSYNGYNNFNQPMNNMNGNFNNGNQNGFQQNNGMANGMNNMNGMNNGMGMNMNGNMGANMNVDNSNQNAQSGDVAQNTQAGEMAQGMQNAQNAQDALKVEGENNGK